MIHRRMDLGGVTVTVTVTVIVTIDLGSTNLVAVIHDSEWNTGISLFVP